MRTPAHLAPPETVEWEFYGSSPSFGTELSHFLPELKPFFDPRTKAWQLVAERYPYKLCRLVHHDYDLSKRWYVIFYAWNVSTGRLQRKRMFDPINKKKTVHSRLRVAEDMILQINAALRDGHVLGLDDKPNKSVIKVAELTMIQAVEFFVDKKRKAKRRENYLRRFERNLIYHLREYNKAREIEDIRVRQISAEYFEDFFDYIREKVESSKTFNNYRADMITVLNFINNARPGTIKGKPWSTTDKLKVVAKKHAAFNDAQMKAIIEMADKMGYDQLVLFCYFEYYTLARPNEILSIKIRDIHLDENRIIILGDEAKNWRDEYVTVNPRFRQIIMESGIMHGHPNDYVFGFMLKPGPERHADEGYFYYRMRKVLEKLDYLTLNPNYTLYSCKHSGAISLYKATKDIVAVRDQCRHKTIQQTWDYLRDLGLLRDESPVMEWQGAI